MLQFGVNLYILEIQGFHVFTLFELPEISELINEKQLLQNLSICL